jgi:short-subunit dehydrogenase
MQEHGVPHLDLVIHNAGVGHYGPLAGQSFASIDSLLGVNTLAPIHLTRTLLAHMHPYGKMVYISSISSDLPVSDYAVYGASKAALDGFVRNLRVELPDRRFQLIHPGAIRTTLHQKSGVPEGRLNAQAFPDAREVAARVIRAIDSSRPEVTMGLANRALQVLGKTLPLEALMALTVTTPLDRDDDSRPPRCVITGFASGIGRALAKRYGRAGYHIIGIDRDAEQAEVAAADLRQGGISTRVLLADLSQEADLYGILTKLRDTPIHCLVHSAGINAVGHFYKSDLAVQEAVFRVNLLAPVKLTAGLLGQGNLVTGARLIFIASLSHYVGYPGASVYAATKDGLAALARNILVPLKTQGIHTLTVFPGPTRTPHAREHSPDNSRENSRMPPEVLAQHIFVAAKRKRRVLVPALSNKAFALIGNLFPELTRFILRRGILNKLI